MKKTTLMGILIGTLLIGAVVAQIIIDPQNNQIIYTNDLFQLNITLLKSIGGEFVAFPVIPTINQTDFGYTITLTDPAPSLAINTYQFTFESSKEIEQYGFFNYIIREDEDSNCFINPFEICPTNDRKLTLEDICELKVGIEEEYALLGYECEEGDYFAETPYCYLILDPECEFTSTNNNHTLEVIFTAPLNPDGTTTIGDFS